jgi:hypothetical protein
MQHLDRYDRKAKLDAAIAMVKEAIAGLRAAGLAPELVSGGGTGSYYFESASGVYNELQCGSYAFMDADYGRILDKQGNRVDHGEWENALFILTSVMSHAKADKAICDAGLKAQSVDSGLPVIYGRSDVKYVKCSDEHGVIEDLGNVLKVGDSRACSPDTATDLHSTTGMSGAQRHRRVRGQSRPAAVAVSHAPNAVAWLRRRHAKMAVRSSPEQQSHTRSLRFGGRERPAQSWLSFRPFQRRFRTVRRLDRWR